MTITAVPAAVPDLLGTSPADLLPTSGDDRHDSTPDEARQRADRLCAGIVGYAQMRQDIADAFACRDWLALGYDNWAAYVEGEFGELLAQLSRGERRQAVADLRGQGMSTRQIAGATGVSPMQVRRDLAQVGPDVPPATVTGKDGKDYASTRPAPFPGPSDAAVAAPPVGPGATPAPAVESPTAPVAPREPVTPPPGSPATWTPEQVEANRLEVERVRMIDRAQRKSRVLVTEIRGLINEVLAGVALGERGLITAEMVADIRKAVDQLEQHVEEQA
jgi:hypothetical protein